MSVTLTSKAIGEIRRFIDKYTSRDELKQFLLDAGADSNRVLAIHVGGNIKSSDYKSKSTIMNEGFDTIYADFGKEEADGVLLELVRVVFARRPVKEEDKVSLSNALAGSGKTLGELLEVTSGHDILRYAEDVMESANLQEARELLKKALLRSSTDPSGSITAAVSACESVCREALSRLDITEPKAKQLPDYLVELRRHSNLEDLAWVQKVEHRAIRALSSLAEGCYQAAHETGDRHAHGDLAANVPPLVLDMLLMSASSVAVVLSGALRRNELALKNQSGQQHE